MCGICGIVDFGGQPVDRALVDRMRDTLTRRGPDDAATDIVGGTVGLGHRRLSIIDLSPRGRQPMANEDGSIRLVFNGEIYDFTGLRAELLAAGHRFASDTDSEVLVHGYEQWGIVGLCERINGMFAFALWDGPRRTLHLARDRLGKKPLWFSDTAGRVSFASEIAALRVAAPGRLREAALARFLFWSYIPGREAIWDDVEQVLPGHIVSFRDGRRSEQRYWRLSFADRLRLPDAELERSTDAVLAAAVRRRLVSDVPLGAFLSGGVDSGYVVAVMKEALGVVRTVTMGTADAEHDERADARAIATHLGTDHVEFEVRPDAWALLPRLVWHFGQPFGDAACIPTFYVAEAARRHVTVALTGDGGDESFAGYSHHQGRWLGALLAMGVPQRVIGGLLRAGAPLIDSGSASRLASAARFLRYAHRDPLVSHGSTQSFALHHLERLWSPRLRGLADRELLLAPALAAAEGFDGEHPLDAALHHDLHFLLPFAFNVKLDVATMMSSLEARSPFQDREVVEWAARIPASTKARPWARKHLLKRVAARRLPRELVYRKKHGFTLPMDAWFRGPWAERARAVVFSDRARARGWFDYAYLERLWDEHRAGRARHGHRFWLLLWLEVWARIFLDQAQPDDTVLRP